MQAEVAIQARAAISRAAGWREALAEVVAATRPAHAAAPDLVLLFASAEHRRNYEALVPAAREATGARLLVGCSGQGIIGPAQEVEARPALSMLQLSLPGVALHVLHLMQEELVQTGAGGIREALAIDPAELAGWLVFADPFHLDAERLIATLDEVAPRRPVIGGLASGAFDEQRTAIFFNDEVHERGAVAIALGAGVEVRTVVAQGATPIGAPWTITGASANLLESIGGRPAYEVLVETLRGLDADVRQRALSNLLVGLAIDEYRDTHGRGDFLVRNLIGVDRDSGALAIGAYPRAGQTVQFQLRDRQAADEDLRELLRVEQVRLAGNKPAAALLCACNGRGAGLFGAPDHDARLVEEMLGPLPLAGFFCNGEVGPVGGRTFLHGFTASIALLLPAAPDAARA